MEVDLLTLVEMRYDKQALAPYEAAYEAESEGCYGTVVDALHMILRLSKEASLGVRVSWRKHDAMKSVGASFSNLSIQDEVVSAVQEPSLGDADAPRLSLKKRCGVDESVLSDDRDASYLSPNKRRGSQLEPIERHSGADDAPEPLLVFMGTPIGAW